MKRGARAIIFKKNKILLIHRIKDGKEYYVLPGGTIGKGESPRQEAIREIKEETNLDVKLGALMWRFREIVKGERREGYYFLARSFQGKIKLGGPELKRSGRENKFVLVWVPVDEIENLLLYPVGLKIRIIRKFRKARFHPLVL